MSRLRAILANHPVLFGIAVTTVVWILSILGGLSAPSVAAETTAGIGSLGSLVAVSTAFGVPGAVLTGYLSTTDSRFGQFVRGYAAAAGGGILATGFVFAVFQIGRGVGPALAAGEPGAALYSLFVFGAIGLFLVGIVLTASLVAAPFAVLGAAVRVRRGR